MARWEKGRRTVQYLVDKGRLENIEAAGLDALAEALLGRGAASRHHCRGCSCGR